MKVFAAATGVMLWSVLAGTARADIFTNSDGFGMDPVITFDEFGAGPVDGTEWQPDFGITFAGLTLEVDGFDPFPGIDGLNLFGSGFDVIIQFDVPIDAFAMAWVTNPGTTTFSLFLNNVPVEEATVATDFDDPSIAFSVFENVTFDRIDAHIDANVQAFRTDNLQFTIVPTATGACCLPDFSCQDLTESECAAAGGLFFGDGAECTTTDCPVDCSAFPCGNNNKVLLCHVPPGNPANAHTICISPNAVAAHLENHEGDHCGPCDDGVQVISLSLPCPADINEDRAINALDLIDLLLDLGTVRP